MSVKEAVEITEAENKVTVDVSMGCPKCGEQSKYRYFSPHGVWGLIKCQTCGWEEGSDIPGGRSVVPEANWKYEFCPYCHHGAKVVVKL